MLDRKTIGYARSLRHYKLKEMDVQHENLSEMQLEEIAKLLNVERAELLDRNSEDFQKEYANIQLTKMDILKVLKKKPHMIKTPIVVYSNRAEFVDSSFSFIKEDMIS